MLCPLVCSPKIAFSYLLAYSENLSSSCKDRKANAAFVIVVAWLDSRHAYIVDRMADSFRNKL